MKKAASLALAWLFAFTPVAGAEEQPKSVTNSLGMEFVLIPAGSDPRAWTDWTETNGFGEKNERQREVAISKPFYLGKYEATQEEWAAVMGENPAGFKGRKNPAETVSWDDVQKFIQALNAKEGTKKYRLPTEAEWEHAARAGSKTEYFFGDNPETLGQYAWYGKNSKGRSPHPVGEKKPNPWGLYDIYGNVWEWTQDWYDEDYHIRDSPSADPPGPASGSSRVIRGGGWDSHAESCRSAVRSGIEPGSRAVVMGFRLAFSPGQ